MSEQKALLTKRDRQLRARVWLGIYLPMILGGLACLGLVVVVGVFGLREENVGGDPASVAGDVAAILVIAQALLILLVPLALTAGLAYLSLRMVSGAHPLLKRGQDLTTRAAASVEELTNSLVGGFVRIYAQGARWQAIKNNLRRSDVTE